MIRVYLDPSYLVLGTQHNPSPPPNFREHLYGVVRCISCPLTSLSRESMAGYKLEKKFEPHRLGKASRSIYMRKNCPTWKGYPTRHGKKTRPSESLALRDEFATFIWLVG